MVEVNVSIIVPLYKVRDYIGKCCDSLFSQTLNGIEYIFVDDATPDDSLKILQMKIEQYPDIASKAKIFRHSQNMGVAEARNTGLNNAQGKYIAFVDADDWIEPDMFFRLYEMAMSKDLDIVGCDWYLEYSQSKRILRQPDNDSVDVAFRAMLRGELRWYLWAFMIKRTLILKNQLCFTKGYNIGEDMAFLLKSFSVADSYGHISIPLYHHTMYNVNSLTRLEADKQFQSVRHYVNEVVPYVNSHYKSDCKKELACYKLNVKFPLLITSDVESYELWNSFYVDSHWAIWRNETQSLRNKLLQWVASKKLYLLVRMYNGLFRSLNKILYR